MYPLKWSLAATESQLTRFLFTTKSSAQSSRLPSRQDTTMFKVDQDLAIIDHSVMQSVVRILCGFSVLELDKRITL